MVLDDLGGLGSGRVGDGDTQVSGGPKPVAILTDRWRATQPKP